MVGAARVDTDRQRVRVRIEGDERVVRPGRAPCILGEGHGAMLGGEGDREIMLPMLAQLMEVFASVGGRNLGDHTCHHSRSIFRSEEHTSELQSLMRISYAVFCLKQKTT